MDPHPSSSPSGALQKVSLTYNMNILQHIPTSKYSNVLVTMNPPHPPTPESTQATISYRHPLYNAAAVRSQNQLKTIQGKRGVWYVGAWTGYGFHEDGFGSGIRVGCDLGGAVPWKVVDTKYMRGMKPVLTMGDWIARLCIIAIQMVLGFVLHSTGDVKLKEKKLKSR